MRISDWSSDVCSSDLPDRRVLALTGDAELLMGVGSLATIGVRRPKNLAVVVLDNGRFGETGGPDRKRVVEGKSVSVRVDLGGRRIITKNKNSIFNKW